MGLATSFFEKKTNNIVSSFCKRRKNNFQIFYILGLATAPVLYACEQYPELNTMLLRKFKHDGDAEKAREIVVNSDGMDKTRRLIDSYSQKAVEMVIF